MQALPHSKALALDSSAKTDLRLLCACACLSLARVLCLLLGLPLVLLCVLVPCCFVLLPTNNKHNHRTARVCYRQKRLTAAAHPQTPSTHILSTSMADATREIKVVVLGDTGVGKSSLVLRFVTNVFKPYSESTIG